MSEMLAAGVIEKRQDGHFVEEANLEDIGNRFDTPSTVYSKRAIDERNKSQFDAITYGNFLPLFASKACGSLAIQGINVLNGLGLQVGSLGEAKAALEAQRQVLGYTDASIIRATAKSETPEFLQFCGKQGIKVYFDSVEGIETYGKLLRDGLVNPDLKHGIGINPGDGDSHDPNHTTTGGPTREHRVYYVRLEEAIRTIKDWNIPIDAAMIHIGSNFDEFDKYFEMVNLLLNVFIPAIERAGYPINEIDVGGGLGRVYDLHEQIPHPTEYGRELSGLMEDYAGRTGRDLKLVVENSRYQVVDGILLTRVLSIDPPIWKTYPYHDDFLQIEMDQRVGFERPDDAISLLCPMKVKCDVNGVAELTRIVMYDETWHPFFNASRPLGELVDCILYGDACEGDKIGMTEIYDTNGDFVKKIPLVKPQVGDIIGFSHSGAYCHRSMTSNYNGTLSQLGLLISGDKVDEITPRGDHEDLWSYDVVPEYLRKT